MLNVTDLISATWEVKITIGSVEEQCVISACDLFCVLSAFVKITNYSYKFKIILDLLQVIYLLEKVHIKKQLLRTLNEQLLDHVQHPFLSAQLERAVATDSPPTLRLNHFNLASTHVTALKLPFSESPMTSSTPQTLLISLLSSASSSLQPPTPFFSSSRNPPSKLLVPPSPGYDHISETDNNYSASITARGVAQGSVPACLLFILCVLPFWYLHCYTDDIQLYISTKSITNITLSTLTNCLTGLKSWTHSNLFKFPKSDTTICLHPKKKMSIPVTASPTPLPSTGVILLCH